MEEEKKKRQTSLEEYYTEEDLEGNEYLNKVKRYHGAEETYNYSFDERLNYDVQPNQWWDDWQTTGEWKGYSYYRKPLLDYQYVEKMASALGSKYQINIRTGKNWSIDLENKVLVYDPISLLDGTKANVIVSLLHEIGHLIHTETSKNVEKKSKSPYLSKYIGAFEVLNLFEDFRVDTLMSKAYEGAEDVFKVNKIKVQELADGYFQRGEDMEKLVRGYVKDLFCILERDRPSIKKNARLKEIFGTSDVETIRKKITLFEEKLLSRDTIFDYIARMLIRSYDLSIKYRGKVCKKMDERIRKTSGAINKAKTAKSTIEVARILNKEVYPVIEDLFDDFENKNKEAKAIFGDNLAKEVARYLNRYLGSTANPNGMSKDTKSRNSGRGAGENIPREWEAGDYNSLKQSVASAIQELVRKLTFLRRKELTARWFPKMKRGKLNPVGLYKYRVGETKLFKQKIETVDTLKSYSFSLMIDSSGSMNGRRIIHAIRGTIILAEVFKKMNIPFETIMFDSYAKILKNFEDYYSRESQGKISGLVNRSGSCTNLDKALEITRVRTRPEKNRIVIILTDCGVGNFSYYEKYFREFRKDNIKTIGLGIESDMGNNSISQLCGNGKEVDDPSNLPEIFAGLLREILSQKQSG